MYARSSRYLFVALVLVLAATAANAQDSSLLGNARLSDQPKSREGSGNYFLALGEREFARGRTQAALERWKLSAFWGHKIAQYNLGLMYFDGVGTGRDRARGLAWLTLAAERGDLPFRQAEAWARQQLSPAEIERADQLRRDVLAPDYADAAALPRAMSQWLTDSRATTGSHLGYVIGNLAVTSNTGTEDGMNRQRHLIEQGGPYVRQLYPRVEVGDLRKLERRP